MAWHSESLAFTATQQQNNRMTEKSRYYSTFPTDWVVTCGPIRYQAAVSFMEARVEAIKAGDASELIWLLEHPPLYTAGTSAKPADLLTADRFPVHTTGRGGQYTYHGPGQRVVYVMLDLSRRGRDLRAFVSALEHWIIATLQLFNIRGETRKDRVGVWVRRCDQRSGREDKIAALGIRLRRWVSFHGLSVNVDPDLSHFEGIRPCGITEHGVTSFADLGQPIAMHELDMALHQTFAAQFGPVRILDPASICDLPLAEATDARTMSPAAQRQGPTAD